MKRIQYIAFIILSVLASSAVGQTDTVFWFAAPEVEGPGSQDRPIVMRLTTYAQAATVTISQPAGGGMPVQTVSVPANSTKSVDLTAWIDAIESKPADVVLNYGLKVSATAPVTAYYDVVSNVVPGGCYCNPDIFVLKGNNALGTDFWIPGQDYVNNHTGYAPFTANSFDIVATQDNTTVTITPSHNIVGHAGGTTFTVVLNTGQTYSASGTSQSAAEHLMGSRVTSDKPITINVKDDVLDGTNFGCSYCADLAGDQIIPTPNLGTEYIAIKGEMPAPYDQVFITAIQNGTVISQNGAVVTTINAGQTYRVGLVAGDIATYIKTSLPAYAYQLTGIGGELGSALLPAVTCNGSTSVSFTNSSNGSLYINLLVKQGGQGNFQINGATGVIMASQFQVVPGTSGVWYAAHIPLSVTTYPLGTVVSVTNSQPFQLGMLNGTNGAGANFGYFSDYGASAIVAAAATPSICVGSTIYLKTDSFANATYSWTGPNGFFSSSRNPVIPNATIADSGTYILTVSGSKCTGSNTTVVQVHPFPAPPLISGDTGYCPGATFIPFIAAGTNILWYNNASGGVGDTTAPTINTAIPGNYTYYASQTIFDCESPRTPVSTVVYTDIVPAFTYNLKKGCQSDTVIFTNTSTNATHYKWSFGDGNIDTATTPTHIYAAQGTYIVKLYASNIHCIDSLIDTITINHPLKAGFIVSQDTICQGQSITFTNTSIGNNLAAFWNFNDSSNSTDASPIHTFNNPGAYQIILVENNTIPCYDTTMNTVRVYGEGAVDFSIKDSMLCQGNAITFIGKYTDTGNLGVQWNMGDGTLVNNTDTVTHAYTFPGDMSVTLTAKYIRCPDTSITKHISIVPYPLLNLGPDTAICPNSAPVLLSDLINENNTDAGWLWNTGSARSSLLVDRPGQYYTTVTINGCSTSDTIWVKNDCYINIPNVFSPNGDGVNDYFFPRQFLSAGVRTFHMQIFNRWGQVIFETNNTSGRGWDGTLNGSPQPEGAYVYMIEVIFINNTTEKHTGNITLLR